MRRRSAQVTLIQRLKEETTELDEPIITAEFEGFWNVFQTFIKNKNW